MRIAGALVVAVLLTSSLLAASPELVVDIRTRPDEELSSNPRYLGARVGEAVLFIGTSYTHSSGVPREVRHVWRTDGTEDGTYPLIRVQTSRPPVAGWIAADGVIFIGVLQPDGARIWRTDGTMEGTRALTAYTVASQQPVASIGERLVYLSNARELRAFTPSGDEIIGTIRQGSGQWTSIAAASSEAFIGTEEGLWRSDGTVAGTRKLASVPSFHLQFAGERLVFAGIDGNGGELWSSDGTQTGTLLLADLSSGGQSTFLRPNSRFASLGATVIFLGSNGQIGATDGTIGGTRLIQHGVSSSDGSEIALMGGAAYFRFDDGVSGPALWRSDGTTEGTRLVSYRTRGIQPLPIAAGTSRVWFAVAMPGGWDQLWLSNGTEAGTRAVLNSALGGYGDRTFATVGDLLFFGHNQPWVSDGFAPGTRQITAIAGAVAGSATPREQATTRAGLYFIARNDEDALELWMVGVDGPKKVMNARRILGATDDFVFVLAGTDLWSVAGEQATLLAKYLVPGPSDPSARVMGSRLLVETEPRLVTDGTVAGTRTGTTLQPGLYATIAGRHFTTMGPRLWSFDDQTDEMRLVASTDGPYSWLRQSRTMAFRGSLLMFTHVPGETEELWELWRSSGNPGDRTRIASFQGIEVLPEGVQLRDHYYFAVRRYHPDPQELWRTDGTAEGTTLVAQLPPGTISQVWWEPALIGDRIVFDVEEDHAVVAPWVTDGTAAGTKRLAPISRYGTYSTERFLSDGRIAYFVADDPDHGLELWRTDGTAAGTALEAEVIPGPGNPAAQVLRRFGDRLYFVATTGETGRELWSYRAPASAMVTIDDARVMEAAGKVAVIVRLDSVVQDRVTVRYTTADDSAKAGRDYTASTGELLFAPGESEKRLELLVPDDAAPEPTRAFLVRIDSDDLPLKKREAAVVIEDDDGRADLSLSITPALTVMNGGPSGAEADVCIASLNSGVRCEAVAIRNGESGVVSREEHSISGPTGARVIGRDPDPDPTNDSVTWISADHGLIVTPATPRVGEPLTIFVETGGSELEQQIYLTCSNPAVIQCPAFLVIPPYQKSASITFVPSRAGEVQIRAGGVVDVRVADSGEQPRMLPVLTFGGDTYWRAGQENRLDLLVRGMTADGRKATGLVTFREEGRPDRIVPVIEGRATLVESDPAPRGARTITASYGGDANFFGRSAPHESFVGRGIPRWEVRRLSGTASFEIYLHAEAGAAPTGTIVAIDAPGERIPLVPAGASASRAVIHPRPGLAEVHLEYSGDDRFDAATHHVRVTPRRRGAGR